MKIVHLGYYFRGFTLHPLCRPAVKTRRDRFVRKFFNQVAAHKSDLVFAIGDTIHCGTPVELNGQAAIAKNCGLDLFRTTGNHDTATLDKAELAPFFLGGRKTQGSEELYMAFDFEGNRFILLDTSRSKMTGINWSGFVLNEQLASLTCEPNRAL